MEHVPRNISYKEQATFQLLEADMVGTAFLLKEIQTVVQHGN